MDTTSFKNQTEVKNDLIHIIGPHKLQNELLSRFLNIKTGFPCSFGTNSNLHDQAKINPHHLPKSPFFLWDCLNIKIDSVFTKIKTIEFDQQYPRHFNAFFNVEPEKEIETKAMHMGIRGIFPKNIPPQMLIKGILAMQKGELWFSRETLSMNVSSSKHSRSQNGSSETLTRLTSREKEILFHICSGSSTKKIAEKLFISPHTVKTHTHNIFKKISVSTRIEASLWANKNLF